MHPRRTSSDDGKVLGPLDEVVKRDPRVAHLLVPGEQPGVHDHDPVEAVRRLDGGAKPDRPAPVVHHERRAAQIELGDQ